MKRLVCFLVVFVAAVVTAYAQEAPQSFLISQEDTACGFARSVPAIFPNHDKGFLVVWMDNRNGPDEYYAQMYDSHGDAEGGNFKVFSNADIEFAPDGSFLCEYSGDHCLDPNCYFDEYDLTGSICHTDETWSKTVSFWSFGSYGFHDCIGCCVGINHDLTSFSSGYLLTFNNGGHLSLCKRNWNLDTVWNWTRLFAPMDSTLPDGALSCINGRDDFAVFWLNANHAADSTKRQVMGTFFDDDNRVLSRDVCLRIVPTSSTDPCWWERYQLRVVAVADSLYEAFLLNADSMKLSYWKIDKYGSVVDPGGSVSFSDGQIVGISSRTSSRNLCLAPMIDGEFSALASITVGTASGHVVRNLLATFDSNGELKGDVWT